MVQEHVTAKQNSTAYSTRLSQEWESMYLKQENELKENTGSSHTTEKTRTEPGEISSSRKPKGQTNPVLPEAQSASRTNTGLVASHDTEANQKPVAGFTPARKSGARGIINGTSSSLVNHKPDSSAVRAEKSQSGFQGKPTEFRPLTKQGMHMVSAPDGSVRLWLRDSSLDRGQGMRLVQQLVSLLNKSGVKLALFTLNSEVVFADASMESVAQKAQKNPSQSELFEYY
ncbi:MAG: hypothetical protein OEZ68_07625 [Gammaproteobacteria bacterium]|nr:hypothetical protein [Gammaproteobacteria bacterium]